MDSERSIGIVLPLARIVAPTDFSEPSCEALRAAQELALHFSSELILVHIVDPVPPLAPGTSLTSRVPAFDVAGYQQVLQGSAQERLDSLARTLSADIKHRSVVKPGLAAQMIVACAEEEHADLIVIGTHGKTGVKRILFGSVAEKVVRTASCPVLTIKSRDEG
jgi:nucleotide-binding universal stress UspA family protein